MRRSLALADRAITFVFAAALLAVSAFAFLWWADWLPADVPSRFALGWTSDLEGQTWYPWSLGGGGLLLCLLGGRLGVAHLRQHRVHKLRLASPGPDTSLHLDVNAALDAACQSFEKSIDIRNAMAKASREGGELVCSFALDVDAEADMANIASECDRVIGELKQCVGRDDLACRTVIKSASHKSMFGAG